MSEKRINAWRFIHPDLDARDGNMGLSLSVSGGIAVANHEISVRQSLLLLLSTAPGERVMRPDYGCALNRLVFAPNDDTTAGIAIHYVREAVERWEPRVEILTLDATHEPNDPPDRLSIYLAYRIRSTQHRDQIVFDISLSGA